MTEYEIYFFSEKIIRLHKVTELFSWYRLSALRDLQVKKFDNVSDGKVIREELLSRGIIIQTYPSNELITSLTLEGHNFEGFLFPADAEQDSKFPKVLRAFTSHFDQNYANPDFEEIVNSPTQEQNFKSIHSNKEVRSFSKIKPKMTYDIPDFVAPPIVQHFHKNEYHVADNAGQIIQGSTIAESNVKQEVRTEENAQKIIPWYITWQFKYIIWPLVVLLIALAVELYAKSKGL